MADSMQFNVPPPPPPLPQHETPIPDVILLLLTITFFQIFDLVHKTYIGPLFASYKALPFRDRFEWDRRALNCTFQLVQTVFNVYIMFFDDTISRDYVYSYSPLAHVAFIVIIGFYVHDTAGFVMHPSPPSFTTEWIAHHVLAVALLAYNIAYRRCSAFPAAAFLISSAGHIPNDLRWWSAAMNIRNQTLLNLSHLLCVMVVLLTCGLPPMYLLFKCSQQLQVSMSYLFTWHMRFYCRFFFLLIYVPHIFLIGVQVARMTNSWNTKPQPFRVTKID